MMRTQEKCCFVSNNILSVACNNFHWQTKILCGALYCYMRSNLGQMVYINDNVYASALCIYAFRFPLHFMLNIDMIFVYMKRN